MTCHLIVEDATFGGIIESLDQRYDGTLPTATTTHQSYRFPCWNGQRKSFEDHLFLPGWICKIFCFIEDLNVWCSIRSLSYMAPNRMLMTAPMTSPGLDSFLVTATAPTHMINAQQQQVAPIRKIIGATTKVSSATCQQLMIAINIPTKKVAKLATKWPNCE